MTLGQSCLPTRQLISVVSSRSDVSAIPLTLETLASHSALGLGLDVISFAIPEVCVSDVEKHFSASENRGALASGHSGERKWRVRWPKDLKGPC